MKSVEQTESGQTVTTIPEKKHRIGTVSYKHVGDSNRFYARATLALGSVVVHKHCY